MKPPESRFGPRLWFHPLFGQSIYQAVSTLGASNGKNSWSSGNIICLTGAEEEKTRSLSLNVMLHSAINPSGNKAGRQHKRDMREKNPNVQCNKGKVI